jgi:hypothetical protein
MNICKKVSARIMGEHRNAGYVRGVGSGARLAPGMSSYSSRQSSNALKKLS